MAALFDHVTRGANASTARASTAAHARSNAVAEDERGVVYVLNVEGETVQLSLETSFDSPTMPRSTRARWRW